MSDRVLITWDLDGVLLDSKLQVVKSWSETCRAMSLWPDVDISKRIGIPLEETLTRETSLDEQTIATFCRMFRENQGLNDALEECFSGARELLEFLSQSSKVAMGFYSARPAARLGLALKKLGQPQARCYSAVHPNHPKPDPRGLLALEESFGEPFSTRLHIGDTQADYTAAVGARFAFIGAAWGYGDPLELGNVVSASMSDLHNRLSEFINA